MNKCARPLLAVSVLSSCFLLLSACGGSGSLRPKSSTITASANVPGTAYANSTFKVSVSLTASKPAASTANVQVVDTGTVTPQIDCGQPKTLTINAVYSTDFSCQAPQANLGSSNVHQLQVDVNGTPNLSSPVSINVVNGGRVDVQLTSASGTVITAAAPGQTVDVAFSTTTTPAGTGQYTVTAPSGWQVGNSGVCNISSTSTSCKVPLTVASNAANGPYNIAMGAELGSSSLSPEVLTLSVQSQTPTNDLTYERTQNFSKTLYANQSGSSGPTSTYIPVFLFKNTSGGSLTVTSVSASALGTVKYGCDVIISAKADYPSLGTTSCTVSNGGLFAVEGTLASANTGVYPVSISVLGGSGTSSKTYIQHDVLVDFVPYVADHVAVHVDTQGGGGSNGNGITLAAVYGGNMVTFALNSNNDYVGTTSSDSSNGSFKEDEIKLPDTGGLIYMPYGASGVIYITRAADGFQTSKVPSATGAVPLSSGGQTVTYPFLNIEMTYQKSQGTCTSSAINCEYLTVDQTYVNDVSILSSFNVMGNSGPIPDSYSSGASEVTPVSLMWTNGSITNLPLSTVFQNMNNAFNAAGAPWTYSSYVGPSQVYEKSYIQKQNGSIFEILSPAQVWGDSNIDPMASTYYDNYVNDLWTFWQSGTTQPHDIRVFASGTGKSSYSKTDLEVDNCVLIGQVVPPSSTSPNAGMLVFNADTSTNCPQYAYAVQGTGFGGAKCGASGTDPCRDSSNNLVFERFNKCDFANAAGATNCHPLLPSSGSTSTSPATITTSNFPYNGSLWGPNGTYRSLIGRAIASYQAAGLLPVCQSGAPVPGTILTADNARADIANGLAYKNPTCVPGVPATPAYWNVYVQALRPYVNVYTYTFSDFLGADGTVTYAENALSQTQQQNMPTAQPITISVNQ